MCTPPGAIPMSSEALIGTSAARTGAPGLEGQTGWSKQRWRARGRAEGEARGRACIGSEVTAMWAGCGGRRARTSLSAWGGRAGEGALFDGGLVGRLAALATGADVVAAWDGGEAHSATVDGARPRLTPRPGSLLCLGVRWTRRVLVLALAARVVGDECSAGWHLPAARVPIEGQRDAQPGRATRRRTFR